MKFVGLPALRYGNLIWSVLELTPEQINDLLITMPVKEVKAPRPASPTGLVIYGFNPSNNMYHEWDSLEKCTHELTGKRFENKATVKRRLNKGILYHGYSLKTQPFNE